jgi:hypothetical protein
MLEGQDVRWLADDLAAKCLSLESDLVRQVNSNLRRQIGVHAILLQNDLTFFLDLCVVEDAVAEDVAENVHENLSVLRQPVDEVRSHVAISERIHLRAQALRIRADLVVRAALRTLERHVLKEVADSVLVLGFARRTYVDEDANGNHLGVLIGERQNAKTI